jgi:hypothetical protein
MTALVWIEWGRPLSKYLRNNIKLHQSMFPSLEQIILADYEYIDEGESKHLSFISIKKLPRSELTKRFDHLSKTTFIPYKDSTFWIATTRRFFLLYDLMLNENLKQALHLESDNVILNFELVKETMSNLSSGIAYPMQSNLEGCGSIFFVTNVDALYRFLDYVCIKWEQGFLTDMQLLGLYSRESQEVEILNTDKEADDIVFDAGSYGKYFVGSDARNFKFPTRRRAVIVKDPTSLLNKMSKLRFRLNLESDNINLSIDRKSKLVNIHIHSKEIPSSRGGLAKLLRKSFLGQRNLYWKIGSLDLLVLRERIASKYYRTLGITRDIRYR